MFKTGEVISSADMNEYFTEIEDRINSLQTQVDALTAGGSCLWVSSGSDYYYSAGNVGIGTASPDTTLGVNGTIKAPVMMSKVFMVGVTGGTGDQSTNVTTAWEAFVGGISDQDNVGHARHRYWVYESGGYWRVHVNYENAAVVNVKVRVLFIRKELFSSTYSEGPAQM